MEKGFFDDCIFLILQVKPENAPSRIRYLSPPVDENIVRLAASQFGNPFDERMNDNV